MSMSTLLNFIVGNKTVELHFFNFSNVLSLVIVPRKSLSDWLSETVYSGELHPLFVSSIMLWIKEGGF